MKNISKVSVIKFITNGLGFLKDLSNNKIDLENRTMVGPNDGQAFAQSIGFEFFQVPSYVRLLLLCLSL